VSGAAPEQLALSLPDSLIEEVARRAAVLVLDTLETHREKESPYMTIPEAAAYLRCKGRQRVDDLLSARRLTRYKDGGRTLVLRAELKALVVARTGPGGRLGGDSILRPGRATVTRPDNRKDL